MPTHRYLSSNRYDRIYKDWKGFLILGGGIVWFRPGLFRLGKLGRQKVTGATCWSAASPQYDRPNPSSRVTWNLRNGCTKRAGRTRLTRGGTLTRVEVSCFRQFLPERLAENDVGRHQGRRGWMTRAGTGRKSGEEGASERRWSVDFGVRSVFRRSPAV